MKKILQKSCLLILACVLVTSCKKFEEINNNPLAANADQVQVEYFINNSIIGTQMDPHIAERIFVLYWKTAGHQQLATGLSGGSYNDGWSSDYYGSSYLSGWLNTANTAIQIADEKIASGKSKTYTNNLKQVARIWRAYLMSELTDNFGPIPLNGFQGANPDFASVKDVYYFMLAELKDANSKIDVAITTPSEVKSLDPAYKFDFTKWKKYANSMRLRLAMRLSEVDAVKAKTEFESAASDMLITATDQIFQVAEKNGWDALTGVMSREWNAQFMSATTRNLTLNIGGVKSMDQLSAPFQASIKAANWMGYRYANHFTQKTNDPSAGYWLDGLPYQIDPRAYKAFIIPGDFSNSNFNGYPSWDNDAETTTNTLVNAGGTVVKTIDAKYTWNAFSAGDWGTLGATNNVRAYPGSIPRLSNQFRASASSRIFFAPWETYFLLAEAAVKGWTVPMTGQGAYEAGVKSNFD